MEQEHHEAHSGDPSDMPVTFEAVINSAAEESIERAARYTARLGTTKASFTAGHAFINGKHFDFTEVSQRVDCGVVCRNLLHIGPFAPHTDGDNGTITVLSGRGELNLV